MNNNILIPLEDIISDSFGKYSKYIIQDRAIPDCRDGLKPGQRRIIYAMFNDGNIHSKPYRKSAKTVGNVIGNYHPHGDSSVYAAMVRMSQNWKLRYPLIDMHGNNGSIDDDPAAAMRYTEARMSKIASMLIENLNDDTIPWSYNFDDTELEPVVLTSKIPNLLINGASGIASGYATEIPPHNLTEILEAAIFIIENPNAESSELMKIIKGPDFPTGGIISNVSGIKNAFETGSGRILIRAKTKISKNEIAISEIPFGVYKSNLVKEIETTIVNSSISGVTYIRDESDRKGLKIAIGLNGTIDGQTILNFLYQKTKLQIWYSYNMVSIVDKKPLLTGVKTLVKKFVEHQIKILINKFKFKKAKLEEKIHILEGLITAIENIDEVISIIRKSNSKAESKENIINQFNFSDKQAEAIVNLRLYRLSATDIKEVQDQHQNLKSQLDKINKILVSSNRINKEMIKELNAIKEEFGDKRRSRISRTIEIQKIDKKDLIKLEPTWISLSKDGYIKRSTPKSYLSSMGIDLNPQDVLMAEFSTDTFSYVVLFFDNGNFASIPIHAIKLTKWKDKGQHISSLLTLSSEINVVKAFIYKEGDDFNIILGSTVGMVKKTSISSFILKRWKVLSVAMKLNDGIKLIGAYREYDKTWITFISQSGFANKFDSYDISVLSPKSAGVKGIKLVDELAVGMVAYKQSDNLVFITDKNQAKRLDSNKLPQSSRTTKGTRINKVIKTNPQSVIWAEKATTSDIIQLTTQSGTIKIDVTKIPLLELKDGNNKFISKKDIIYSAMILTTNNKKIVKLKKDEKLTQEVFKEKNKKKGQINLFDILDDI